MFKRMMLSGLLLAVCFLAGCAMQSVDQLYWPPKRPQSYNDFQSVMENAMMGMEYCAPLSGENRQMVQMADLDGDGIREYIVFAKESGEQPLKILIFSHRGGEIQLLRTVSSNGTAFDLVEYADLDGDGGDELIVGCQLSDRLIRNVSIYRISGEQVHTDLTAQYTKFLTCDLNADSCAELLILRPEISENGVAELYAIHDGNLERYREVELSAPAQQLKRIIPGKLHGGTPAVFVGSLVDEDSIITDVFALVDGQFVNVALGNVSGTGVQTLRSYYVYADDIDEDGEVELPALIPMKELTPDRQVQAQHLIRWYAMGVDGSEIDKLYTYHDYLGGWYMELESQWAERICVTREEHIFHFYLWDGSFTQAQRIFSIYMLTGEDREVQALEENKFILYKGETVVYAAHMEVASGEIELSQQVLIEAFRLIRQDWKTGEM